MILNLSKIKTEALLLFCKDLIRHYINERQNTFEVNDDILTYMSKTSSEMLVQMEYMTYPNDYYLKNAKNFRIKAVLAAYNLINKEVSKVLEKEKEFNPSMFYLSLLAMWFKELNHESRSKEYMYFIIYPYSIIYDKLLVNIEDEKFKALNINMLEAAEKVILQLEQMSFRH